MCAIEHIRALDKAGFVALLGPLYEHSPWAAERAFAVGPFDDVEAVGASLRAAVDMASENEKLQLIRAHPELAGEKLRAKALTESSMSEQTSRGLDQLGEEELKHWTALNTAYREKFGFPFVICVRLHSKDGIVAALEQRFKHSQQEERAEAIRQIHDIAKLRLEDIAASLGTRAG